MFGGIFGGAEQLCDEDDHAPATTERDSLTDITSAEPIPEDEEERLGKPNYRRPNVEEEEDQEPLHVAVPKDRFLRKI